MNKVANTVVAVLALFIGWCGWLAHNTKGTSYFGNQHCLNHVQNPPPISVEAMREERAIAAAAVKADADLKVNGRHIVTTGMLPRHLPR